MEEEEEEKGVKSNACEGTGVYVCTEPRKGGYCSPGLVDGICFPARKHTSSLCSLSISAHEPHWQVYPILLSVQPHTQMNTHPRICHWKTYISSLSPARRKRPTYLVTPVAFKMSASDQPGPPGTMSRHTSSTMVSSGASKDQLGLCSALSHLKSSTWL